MSEPDSDRPGKLTLTDDGLEAPDHVVGRTGRVTVEKPHLQIDITFEEPVKEIEPELLKFPPTGDSCRGYEIPEGHVRIDGVLYEIVDDRDLDRCPHCGSDKVAVSDDPPRCYGCDTDLDDSELDDECLLTDGGPEEGGVECYGCHTEDDTVGMVTLSRPDGGTRPAHLCDDCETEATEPGPSNGGESA